MKILKKKISILLISTIITISYFIASPTVGKDQKVISGDLEIKRLLDENFRLEALLIKLNKLTSLQERKLSRQEKALIIIKTNGSIDLSLAELDKKKRGDEIEIKKSKISLLKNLSLEKYLLTSGFYAGINNRFPGSGYIDFYEDNILVLSARGVLAFKKNLDDDKENFTQIKNNINKFIGLKQFHKKDKRNDKYWFSLKDIFIFNGKVFVSYTEEIKEDCWNTSIIYGDMNYENIKFKKLFSPKECVHSARNIDNEFNAHQSGGKIISFDDNHILLSIGEYRSRYLAQDKKSVNGKIIKINLSDKNYTIISMGHRNPQGLYFDKENNFILETEHGPNGGDEINLIAVDKIKKEIPNYGWPISSAGKHYGSVGIKKYEKYPLYNSHSEYGFIEPLKSFVPSIGISAIVKIGKNKYVMGSMRSKSLYFFKLNKQREIINLDVVKVHERVRDLRFKDNKLYLFMEDTASIGVISFN